MKPNQLLELAKQSLESIKGQDIQAIDLQEKTNIADFMLIVSGTSDRHLRAMANQLIIDSKKAGTKPLGIEGENSKDWILVDLGSVIVHLMRPEIRELYALEKLWSIKPSN